MRLPKLKRVESRRLCQKRQDANMFSPVLLPPSAERSNDRLKAWAAAQRIPK